MIDLHTAATPNGYKASIMLEETRLPYRVNPVDFGRNEQLAPAFLALNPNNKIPVIVDRDAGRVVFESGAILFYLAEKSGRFQPRSREQHYDTLQWVLFQAAHVGPMLGQLWYFLRSAPEPVPAALTRYTTETRRILGVLERRLGETPYLAGEYGIADIMTWPWIASHGHLDLSLDEFPRLKRWHETIGARPAVQKGITIPAPSPAPRPARGS